MQLTFMLHEMVARALVPAVSTLMSRQRAATDLPAFSISVHPRSSAANRSFLAAEQVVHILGCDKTDGEIFQLREGQFSQAPRGGG